MPTAMLMPQKRSILPSPTSEDFIEERLSHAIVENMDIIFQRGDFRQTCLIGRQQDRVIKWRKF